MGISTCKEYQIMDEFLRILTAVEVLCIRFPARNTLWEVKGKEDGPFKFSTDLAIGCFRRKNAEFAAKVWHFTWIFFALNPRFMHYQRIFCIDFWFCIFVASFVAP